MPCHLPAEMPVRKSSLKQASLLKLIQHFSIIQSEISQSIDRAFLMRSSNLREILSQLLFLSLLQQTHTKTIKLSGRKGSEPSNAVPCSDTRCHRTTLAFRPTCSSSSTELTCWLNSEPYPVTSPKPIVHTSHGSSLNPLPVLEVCKRGASMRKRTKSLGG